MQQTNDLKPKKRGRLRLLAGKTYYTAMRYMLWHSGRFKFAKKVSNKQLPHSYFAHQSPLLRRLRDVDMWYQYNKIANLKIAVPNINGLMLYPGETFSYWKAIGNPTRRKGYVEGMVLLSGRFGPGIGGGLCQLSNLLYWISLHTPLTVVERYRHGYDVFPDSSRTRPFGSGATCFYPYRDLMVQNNTRQPFQLCAEVGKTFLKAEWRCQQKPQLHYEVFEKDHVMKPEYWGGFSRHNKLYRRAVNDCNEVLQEEFVAENHAMMMYSPFLQQPDKPVEDT